MKDCDSTKESKGTKVYTPPVCEVIFVETQKIICSSETEDVGEFEGIW